jgi:hypothetical protein
MLSEKLSADIRCAERAGCARLFHLSGLVAVFQDLSGFRSTVAVARSDHSTFAPESFTTFAQSFCSERSSLRNSSGELPTGSAPSVVSRDRTAGELSAFTAVAEEFDDVLRRLPGCEDSIPRIGRVAGHACFCDRRDVRCRLRAPAARQTERSQTSFLDETENGQETIHRELDLAGEHESKRRFTRPPHNAQADPALPVAAPTRKASSTPRRLQALCRASEEGMNHPASRGAGVRCRNTIA